MLTYRPITQQWMQQNLGECLWLHEEWSREDWLIELPRKFELSRAIYLGGTFIGVMIVSYKGWPHLHLIKLRPHYRHSGYGGQAFDHLLLELQRLGERQLTWKVRKDNAHALKLYQSYNPVQEEDGDSYLMTKQLNRRVVTIHQPNFMPWVPFFEKIRAADVYVVLSRCAYSKGGHQNRFDFLDKRLTMSVKHAKLGTSIYDMQYVDAQRSWFRIKKSVPHPEVLQLFDRCIGPRLLPCNLAIIRRACELLGINTEIVLDEPTEATGTARLIELVKKNDGDIYLSGRSGRDYLDESLMTEAGIAVQYQAKPSRPMPLVEYLA